MSSNRRNPRSPLNVPTALRIAGTFSALPARGLPATLRIAGTLAALALTGCGFSPLYDQSGPQPVAAQLDNVYVANIPERPGQMLRLSLETQLHADGEPTAQLYTLNVYYSIATSGIGVQQDTATTRNRFIATANWTLTPIGTPGKPLAHGIATTEDAANIIDQQYFALNLETDTVNQQLATEIATQITTQLAAWFHSHPS